jgi:hypothetical protein
LPDEYYLQAMKDFDLSEIQMQRKPLEIVEKESPSYVIGYNRDNIVFLLEALKLNNNDLTREVISLMELLQVNLQTKQELSSLMQKAQAVNQDYLSNVQIHEEITSTQTHP